MWPRVRLPVPVSHVGWVCCWFSSLLREVFLRVLRFSPLLKNQHIQIPIRSWRFPQLAFCAKYRWRLNKVIYLFKFFLRWSSSGYSIVGCPCGIVSSGGPVDWEIFGNNITFLTWNISYPPLFSSGSVHYDVILFTYSTCFFIRQINSVSILCAA